MSKQRYNFTLLEIMISLALLGMLLAFLFTFFRQTLHTKNETVALKEKVLKMEFVQLRLKELFERFSPEDQPFIATLPHADAVGQALFIHCDHGIDPHPAFSGRVHSMLFKSRDQRLCLCIFSQKQEAKVDTLLSGVKELSFAFFNGKQWQTQWPKDKKDPAFPLLLKVTVLLQGSEEQRQDLFFTLPPKTEITYAL
jgi:Type II secretion system (T2SS), protein J